MFFVILFDSRVQKVLSIPCHQKQWQSRKIFIGTAAGPVGQSAHVVGGFLGIPVHSL